MQIILTPDRVTAMASPLLYGQFLEHFHRQIYGGVYDPASHFADADGFRTDVIEALRGIRAPIIRWPGGCFVSSYDWKKGVGPVRTPVFDKAWRVEEPNTFGTDEFIRLCRKIGCEPYICTNAGTGTAWEMSDWVEYCNLKSEGEYARLRAGNGSPEPHNVRYWSIGNENYGHWEIGAKGSNEWAALATEAAKMMKRVDPEISLSAAALVDLDWNVRLLSACGSRLDWISIHGYWDNVQQTNALAPYARCMGYTEDLEAPVRRVRGLLNAMGLEKGIRIAFDEWNLRGWYHPNVHTLRQGVTPEEYLLPRDRNDDNNSYTMADAVFSACFLNMVLRNADLVGMACFAPAVNTRGAIFTHPGGIVKRTTYYVFRMYTSLMGREVIDLRAQGTPLYRVPGNEGPVDVPCVDTVAARCRETGALTVALVNKHETDAQEVEIKSPLAFGLAELHTLCGESPDDYNDIGRETVKPFLNPGGILSNKRGSLLLRLPAHSVNILRLV